MENNNNILDLIPEPKEPKENKSIIKRIESHPILLAIFLIAFILFTGIMIYQIKSCPQNKKQEVLQSSLKEGEVAYLYKLKHPENMEEFLRVNSYLDILANINEENIEVIEDVRIIEFQDENGSAISFKKKNSIKAIKVAMTKETYEFLQKIINLEEQKYLSFGFTSSNHANTNEELDSHIVSSGEEIITKMTTDLEGIKPRQYLSKYWLDTKKIKTNLKEFHVGDTININGILQNEEKEMAEQPILCNTKILAFQNEKKENILPSKEVTYLVIEVPKQLTETLNNIKNINDLDIYIEAAPFETDELPYTIENEFFE